MMLGELREEVTQKVTLKPNRVRGWRKRADPRMPLRLLVCVTAVSPGH